MAKAIHWPLQFRDEILADSVEKRCSAIRLGTLYYDNQYWVSDEVVDIRVNHKKIRKGVVVGELKCCMVGELTAADLAAYRQGFTNPQAVAEYLAANYNQPVDEATIVTVVYYKNLPVIPEDIEQADDPHL